jgi:hypothetical protein
LTFLTESFFFLIDGTGFESMFRFDLELRGADFATAIIYVIQIIDFLKQSLVGKANAGL